jgi:hypothetical protein
VKCALSCVKNSPAGNSTSKFPAVFESFCNEIFHFDATSRFNISGIAKSCEMESTTFDTYDVTVDGGQDFELSKSLQ